MKCLLCHLFGTLLASIVLFAVAVPSVHATNCVYEHDLSISLQRNTASITNNSAHCNYEVTLAAYDMPYAKGEPQWIDAQELLDSKTVTVSAGQSVQISVNDASSKYCRVQTDLFRGSNVLTPPFYYNNLADEIYTKDGCGTQPSPTPSATPVATVAPSPEVKNDVPTSDGRSDGLGCSVKDCSGNPIGAPAVGGPSVLGARTLPVTGEAATWLLQVSVLGVIAGVGVLLKRHANKLENN